MKIKTIKTKTNLILLLVLTFLFFYIYKEVILDLIQIWLEDGNYSHGFLVPILSGYIIWKKREKLKNTQIKVFWPSSLLVLFSGFLLLAGQLTVHGFSRNISFILMIFSLTLLILGKDYTKEIILPLAFLLFMIPLPEIFTRKVTAPLQILSSIISVNTLTLMNYPAYREGNIIYLPQITLSVVEACSGLRSILALLFLTTSVGYFVLKSNYKRIILILCAFPIAILLNWARIIGTSLLAFHWGQEVAQGFFHTFSGLIIFALATIMVGLIILFLKKREDHFNSVKDLEDNFAASSRDNISSIRITSIIIALGLLLIISFYGSFLFSLKPSPLINLNTLPLQLGPYHGKKVPIDLAVSEFSGVTEDWTASFYIPEKPSIEVYLGYYRTDKNTKRFFHGSDVCLPGAGWKISKKTEIELNTSNDIEDKITVLRYVSNKANKTQVMVTWLQAGNTIGTGSREFRIKLLLDIILNLKYNDTTKIMISTLLGEKESIEEATDRLSNFFKYFYPNLNRLII